MSDEIAHLPQWVRRRDGSQVPFDADRICQSLYEASESLGASSAFLTRELTDVVLHFIAKDPFDGIPTTTQMVSEIEKIVREVGQPELARRFVELQAAHARQEPDDEISIACDERPGEFVRSCLESYSLRTVYSRDVAAAVREGLMHLSGLEAPEALSSVVLETPRLAELPWWLALDDWRGSGHALWVVDGPEWLCTPQMHPALTPHLCERLLSLPTLAERAVELHLNITEPPSWAPGRQKSLFSLPEDEESSPERSNFLDGLLERWKSLNAPRLPAIAWHVHERSFRDDTERRQLQELIRLALQGRPVRFILDRPDQPIHLSEGLDRRCPGVLLEIGVDLPAFAARAEVANDAVAFLKKLPSLTRMAVSAAAQKRQYLRRLPEQSPLRRRFLIERAAAVIVPHGLNAVVRSLATSVDPRARSLALAAEILRVFKETLRKSGRAINLDLRLECPAEAFELGSVDDLVEKQKLAAAGAINVAVNRGHDTLEVLHEVWSATSVVRFQLVRDDDSMEQGELLS